MHMAALTLIFVAITAGVVYLLHVKQIRAQPPGPPKAKESVALALEAKGGFDILKARWQRPDGGYVIDIREVAADGKMSAAYFNPRTINISQAEATREGNTPKVFLELRDVHYPGATYHLTYDPGSDQLKGVYFQPALQQSFQVSFVRMK